MKYISCDEDLESAIKTWSEKKEIAVDFEGEFNLHVYGEHLCLIQVFDGDEYYIVDPLSKAINKETLIAFFSLDVKKVWFDCQSDHSLVYKLYGSKINNIFDIRVLAKLLGFNGNLISLEKEYLGLDIKINKKKNQQANWLRRPLDDDLIEYALLDVAHLMELEDVLMCEIKKRGLEDKAKAFLNKANAVKKPEDPWRHVVNWKMISKRERVYVRNIFLARDSIAKRFKVPAYYVMDKHRIGELAAHPPKDINMLRVRIQCEPKRFLKFLEPAIWSAIEKSEEEVKNLK